MAKELKPISDRRIVIAVPFWVLEDTKKMGCNSVEEAFNKFKETLLEYQTKIEKANGKIDGIAEIIYNNALTSEQKLQEIERILKSL